MPPHIDEHIDGQIGGNAGGNVAPVRAFDAFRDGFLVTLFNPKGILFFVAFVPQFIDARQGYAAQAVFFALVFVGLGMLDGAVYALGASAMRRAVRRLDVLRTMNRFGGATIAAAGVAAVFAKRPAS